jgi:post-segregation antitoxin (ccd killing protein)
MPKVSVYLSDELYERARQQGLSLSSLTQAAVERELAASANAGWIARARDRPPRFRGRVDTTELLDEVREEFGA